ncbi:glutamate racemase [Salinisphaera sp. T31B1]|uniref:glutamate racemase n=1 Tax=Salinisphaera sp. T31B1 TaxID=727963 RepID=UPI00333FD0FF
MFDGHPISAPLLVFDSGVGGLSILAHIRRQLPKLPVVYAMDTAGYPYGERDDADLRARIPDVLARLTDRYRPRMVVVACNTASTIALDAVRQRLSVPVVGTVPAIKTAAERTASRVVGILGTAATVRQRYTDDLARRFASGCRVVRHGAPALVEYVEARLAGRGYDTHAPLMALAGLLEQPDGERIDTVVLACTHFPLVRSPLEAACPRPLAFVDSGRGIAARVAALIGDCPAMEAPRRPDVVVTTADIEPLNDVRPLLARYGLARLESCRVGA